MGKKRVRRSAQLFRRLVSTDRFPDEREAVEFARGEAQRAGVAVEPEPEVVLISARMGDAWLIEFERKERGG